MLGRSSDDKGISTEQALRGRRAWRDFFEAQPYPKEGVVTFAARLERLMSEVRKAAGCDYEGQYDQILIWHTLNMLDDIRPDWKDHLAPDYSWAHDNEGPSIEDITSTKVHPVGGLAEELASTRKTTELPAAAEKVADESLPDVAVKKKKNKKKKAKKSTYDASYQPGHRTVGAVSDQAAVTDIIGVQVNDFQVNANGGLGDDAIDYDDCRNSDAALEARSIDGDDNDYARVANRGFADDVYDGDGDNVDERVIVYINDEVRYAIPGYESRKKPRHTLITAPRFVIQNFFRSKFPGRPKCPDCRFKHPEDGYLLCSYCDFCHMGGDDECYYQNPHLRGTRPAKEKYTSKKPELSEEAVVEAGLEEGEPGGEPGLEPVFEPKIKAKTKTKGTKKSKKKDKRHFDADREPQPAAATKYGVQAQPGLEMATAVAPEKDNVLNLATALGALNIVETPTPSKPAKPLVFDSPQTSFVAGKKSVRFDLVTRLNEAAKHDDPVEEEPIMFKEPAQTEEGPFAESLLLETEPAPEVVPTVPPTETVAADGEGGAMLTEDNLSRVPHSKGHRHWASMSSLTTSSSGASLAAFCRRRTNELERSVRRKAEKKDAKVAAEKAAAEEAAIAAEKAAQHAALAEAERRAAMTQQQFDTMPKKRRNRGGRKNRERQQGHSTAGYFY
ncbi:hypothetical protein SCUCBS95973_004244 [Sporothrix curviconia]|uniref:Uncharacterized protein n=1 Tax=Sporothrix curviconia TaxID=1260050 RepID=A0ABP0BNA7_9PEZI